MLLNIGDPIDQWMTCGRNQNVKAVSHRLLRLKLVVAYTVLSASQSTPRFASVLPSLGNDRSQAQRSIGSLKKILGLAVTVTLPFSILWDELQKQYPFQGAFAHDVVDVVKTWATALTARFQDNHNAAWTEVLLEFTTNGLNVRVNVCCPV